MSLARTFASSIVALFVTVGVAFAEEARVSVMFAKPEKYTDLRTSCVSHEADGRALRTELERFLVATAMPLLGEGRRIEITVTNIDMAGEFENWRRPQLCDVRIMKDVYPPRIDLTFRLIDGAGVEQRAGSRRLRDVNYLSSPIRSTSDSLRYEKSLLADWLRRELGPEAGS